MSDSARRNHDANANRPGRSRKRATRWLRGPQLTDRDIEIVRWITRHGVVTPELVGRRFFWRPERRTYGEWAAYRRLAALVNLGLVLRVKPYAHQPALIRATREGARIANVGLRPAPLVLSQLKHTLALVFLTERLLYDCSGAELVTERELRAQRHRALQAGNLAAAVGRIPDALLRIPVRSVGAEGITTVAVELDVSRKDRRAMERMIDEYRRAQVDAVWWYVTPGRVERVRDLVRVLDAHRRIEVRAWHG